MSSFARFAVSFSLLSLSLGASVNVVGGVGEVNEDGEEAESEGEYGNADFTADDLKNMIANIRLLFLSNGILYLLRSFLLFV